MIKPNSAIAIPIQLYGDTAGEGFWSEREEAVIFKEPVTASISFKVIECRLLTPFLHMSTRPFSNCY